jgi:hypothetical protein
MWRNLIAAGREGDVFEMETLGLSRSFPRFLDG